jgi:hypothetical protein
VKYLICTENYILNGELLICENTKLKHLKSFLNKKKEETSHAFYYPKIEDENVVGILMLTDSYLKNEGNKYFNILGRFLIVEKK